MCCFFTDFPNFLIVFLFFDGFLIIHVFIKNQLLIFRKKLDNHKSIKNKNIGLNNAKINIIWIFFYIIVSFSIMNYIRYGRMLSFRPLPHAGEANMLLNNAPGQAMNTIWESNFQGCQIYKFKQQNSRTNQFFP